MMKRGFLLTKKGCNALSVETHGVAKAHSQLVDDLEIPPRRKRLIRNSYRGCPEGYPALTLEDSETDQVEMGFKDRRCADKQQTIFVAIPDPDQTGVEESDVGWTQCVFVGSGTAHQVLSIDGFPKPVPKPSHVCYRIAPSAMDSEQGPNAAGLGMFATTDMKLGDLILAERPLLLLNALLDEDVRRVLQRSPEKSARDLQDKLERLVNAAVERMSEERQRAFWALANSHLHDGSGEATGRMWTNSFGVTVAGQLHYGVFSQLSRINHSCCPNAMVWFDHASFAGRLSVMKSIKQGEEITVSYCETLIPAEERQRQLEPYGFRCTCNACSDPEASDALREQIKVSNKGESVDAAFVEGIVNQAKAKEMVRESVRWLHAIEDQGVTHSDLYAYHLVVALKGSIALLDKQSIGLYLQKLQMWNLAVEGHSL